MKNMYEVFDEFEAAGSKKEKMKVIEKNLSNTLVEVLKLTYHPNYNWLVTEMPDNYVLPTDSITGLGKTQLSVELRKIYLFQKGHPTAEKLTPRKLNELLIQFL